MPKTAGIKVSLGNFGIFLKFQMLRGENKDVRRQTPTEEREFITKFFMPSCL